jgi:hypothetical protein
MAKTKTTKPEETETPDEVRAAARRLRASSPPHDELTAAALATVLDYVDPPQEPDAA